MKVIIINNFYLVIVKIGIFKWEIVIFEVGGDYEIVDNELIILILIVVSF